MFYCLYCDKAVEKTKETMRKGQYSYTRAQDIQRCNKKHNIENTKKDAQHDPRKNGKRRWDGVVEPR
jgi:hypothetical protein